MGKVNPHIMWARTNGDDGRVGLETTEPSMTRQAPAEQQSISEQMKLMIATGFKGVSFKQPRYGDFSGLESYHDAVNRLAQAEDDFLALPATIRSFCDNDPGLFLEYMNDPEHRAYIEQELGLPEEAAPVGAAEAAKKGKEPPKTEIRGGEKGVGKPTQEEAPKEGA